MFLLKGDSRVSIIKLHKPGNVLLRTSNSGTGSCLQRLDQGWGADQCEMSYDVLCLPALGAFEDDGKCGVSGHVPAAHCLQGLQSDQVAKLSHDLLPQHEGFSRPRYSHQPWGTPLLTIAAVRLHHLEVPSVYRCG